jgi:hypothetical protein
MTHIKRIPLVLATLCMPALADTIITPGPWDLYFNSTLQQVGFSSEAACADTATLLNVTRTYTCRTRSTIGVTQVTTPPPPPPPPSGNTYTTNFIFTENPVSEAGVWTRNLSNQWQKLQSIGGAVIAANYTESFDDAYSTVSVPSNDYEVIATVYWPNQWRAGEHEILLRVTDGPNFVKGYEFLYNGGGSWQLVRWNGPLGDYTVIHQGGSVPSGHHGAQIRAAIVGSNIKLYWRDKPADGWTFLNGPSGTNDATHTTGKPGIGIYVHAVDGNRMNVGFKSFTVNGL